MKTARESGSRRSRRNAIGRLNFAKPLSMQLVSVLVADVGIICECEQVASLYSTSGSRYGVATS